MKLYDDSLVDCNITVTLEVARGDFSVSRVFSLPQSYTKAQPLGAVGDSLQRLIYNALYVTVTELNRATEKSPL